MPLLNALDLFGSISVVIRLASSWWVVMLVIIATSGPQDGGGSHDVEKGGGLQTAGSRSSTLKCLGEKSNFRASTTATRDSIGKPKAADQDHDLISRQRRTRTEAVVVDAFNGDACFGLVRAIFNPDSRSTGKNSRALERHLCSLNDVSISPGRGQILHSDIAVAVSL